MKAMILSAGLGTRLRPLTERWPKPAMPLLGQPLLRYALSVVTRAGVDAVGINTHHLPEVMEMTARRECERKGVPLTVAHEPVIQGTGGGIRGLRELFRDGTFVVINGDVLFALDLAPVISAHEATRADATMVLLPLPANERYAAVEIDPDGKVRRIAGIGPGGPRLSPWHFTGVHVMSPVVFDFMSASGPEDINREVYPRMIEKGLLVRGHLVDPGSAYWSDVGTPARYAATHKDLLYGQVRTSLFGDDVPFATASRTVGNFWAHPSAWLSDVKVAGPAFFAEGCELGANVRVGAGVSVGCFAHVGEGAALNRVAVLDGAEVPAGRRLEDCLVLPGEEGESGIVVPV
ncbi:MAG: sugar phosphate nucleotidyltransferase [Myxococcota bacterium]